MLPSSQQNSMTLAKMNTAAEDILININDEHFIITKYNN